MTGFLLASQGLLYSSSDYDPSTALVWLDPSDLSTLWTDTGRTTNVSADGQAIAAWDNKGTAGGNYSQATASKRPTYKTSAGLHWSLGDGVDDYLEISSRFGLGANPNLTVVVGINVTTNAASSPRIWGLSNSVAGLLSGATGSADGWSWRHFNGYEAYSAITTGTSYVATWRRPSGGNYSADRFFLDGTEDTATGSSGGTTSPDSTVAYSSIHGLNLASGYSNVRIYGLILDEVNDDATQALMESYMATKAGVTL